MDNERSNNTDSGEKSGLGLNKPKPTVDVPPSPQTQTRQPTEIGEPKLKNISTQVTCPVCHANVLSEIKYRNGIITYAACFALALVGCFCGCCLIPFCSRALRDVEHTCPNCKSSLGIYSVLS